MINTAIYLRISVLEKGNLGHTEDTINSQRNIIKNFIFNDQELKKANIEEYIDEGYSGSTTSRPGLNKLLLKVKQGKINRSEEHTSELQSRGHLVCRLMLEKKNDIKE